MHDYVIFTAFYWIICLLCNVLALALYHYDVPVIQRESRAALTAMLLFDVAMLTWAAVALYRS